MSARADLADGFRGRSENEFRSVDSSPARFVEPTPPRLAPLMLAAFLALAAFLQWLLGAHPALEALFPRGSLILAPARGEHAVSIRVFMLSFLTAFGLFAPRTWRRRLLMTLDMTLTFLAACAATDAALVVMDLVLGLVLHMQVIEIAAGLCGFVVFAFKLLEWGRMPSRVAMEIHERGRAAALLRMTACMALASAAAALLLGLAPGAARLLRDLGLLGGIGPGVFLVFPIFFLLLYGISRLRLRRLRRVEFAPDLTVLIPALNEAYIIAGTIRALDAAAARHGGEVSVILVDNGSRDGTAAIARAALGAARHLRGEVLEERAPGKSEALNLGLARIRTELFVRIDADTLVGPRALVEACRLMADPRVGVVGGMPLAPGRGPFDRSRSIEVHLRHGFYNIGMNAINAVVSIPGMFALYRTRLARELDGFVVGMNGEDTASSLRIGELGFRLMVEPRARYTSEVPVTLRHLREQRLRWFRSTLHVSARCRDLLYSDTFTIRGKIVLPFMLANLARRAMTLPLALFGLLTYLSPFARFDALGWQALVATAIGAPAMVAALALLLNGAPGLLLALPEYLCFRLLRAYFTLESMMSVRFKDDAEPFYGRKALAERGARPTRLA